LKVNEVSLEECMGKHESSVNFRNLIRDLAEMYPFDIEEVIITELIANSLDAKATLISIDYDNSTKKLIFTDNGEGMTEDQFSKYHNLAAGLKTRGTGIGFAGVGAKISFNIADRVITETRSSSFNGGSNWQLEKLPKEEEKLIWTDIQPVHIQGFGTRVEIDFSTEEKLSYTTSEDFIYLIRKHYLPLLDKKFIQLYSTLEKYKNVQFRVNGAFLPICDLENEFEVDKYKETFLSKSSQMIGFGFIGLAKEEYPLGEDLCGVLISVFGKVIKSELFNQFPGRDGARIIGVFEVPGLISFLNTSKIDFIRSRSTHKKFESYYGPLREFFKRWLEEAGIQTQEIDISQETLKIERELKKILEDIPELGDFFGFRSRKNLPQPDDSGDMEAINHEGIDSSFPIGDGKGGSENGIPDIGEDPGNTFLESDNGQKAKPISRSAKHGPKIAFSNSPDRIELAWVEGNTVYINTGHKIMSKVSGDYKDKRIIYLVSIGCAIQRFLTTEESPTDLLLIDRIFDAWGKK